MAEIVSCSFINFSATTSKEDRLRNRYLIRARTVRRNRQEQLLRKGNEHQQYSTRKNNGPTRKLLPMQTRLSPAVEHDLNNKSDDARPQTDSPRKAHGHREHNPAEALGIPSAGITSSLTLTSPVSPFFGALATDTFDSSSYSTISEISVLGSLLAQRHQQTHLTNSTHQFSTTSSPASSVPSRSPLTGSPSARTHSSSTAAPTSDSSSTTTSTTPSPAATKQASMRSTSRSRP